MNVHTSAGCTNQRMKIFTYNIWKYKIDNSPSVASMHEMRGVAWNVGHHLVSLPYKQRAFIIYDNDITLKIYLSASGAFRVTVGYWLGPRFGYG